MTRQSRCAPDDDVSGCSCGPLQVDDARARTAWHLARWYVGKGWTVRTRLPGWGLPPRVAGHMPDVYASDGARELAVDIVIPGERPPLDAHLAAFRAWQAAQPTTRRYALETAHASGANRIDDAPAGGWVDGEGRIFW